MNYHCSRSGMEPVSRPENLIPLGSFPLRSSRSVPSSLNSEALAIQDSFREVIQSAGLPHAPLQDAVRSSPCAPLILKTGVLFPEVILSNFLTGAVLTPYFCTWGPSDLMELQRNMALSPDSKQLPVPLSVSTISRKLFSIRYEDRRTRRKSLEICRRLSLRFQKRSDVSQLRFLTHTTPL